MATDMVQMNVRIPRALKVAGDEALASVGFTPSGAVRALWEKVAERGEGLSEIVSLLSGTSDAHAMASLDDDDPVFRGQRIIDDGLRAMGIDPSRLKPSGLSDEELMEAAYYDKMAERGLL